MGNSRIVLSFLVVAAGGGCGSAGDASNSSVVVSQADGGGHADAGAPSRQDAATAEAEAGEPGAAPTWTVIYQTLLINTSYPSNCTGSSCHDPGKQKGIDLSSPASGYSTISGRLVPGSPDKSDLVTVLQSGFMPQGRPQMAASDVSLIRAWIQAGAPND